MKSGLEYFPLDVSLDTKFELIEAEFGLKGFGVVVKLLQRIYGQEGYYIEWTNEVLLLFARSCGLGGNDVSEIVKASVRRGIFDQNIFDRYQVLTSKGIQKRYLDACSRRKVVDMIDEYLLVDCTHCYKNVNILSRNVNILSKNADNFKQSKVEESKVKKSKDIYSSEQNESAREPVIQMILNDGSFYPIYIEDVKLWKQSYPAVDIVTELKRAYSWLDANPKKRKTQRGIRNFINSWMARCQDKGGSSNFNPTPNYSDPNRYVGEKEGNPDDI